MRPAETEDIIMRKLKEILRAVYGVLLYPYDALLAVRLLWEESEET